MKKIGVLISGSGTNLQALIDGIYQGRIKGEIGIIISNKPDAFGLVRGHKAGIETLYIPWKGHDIHSYSQQLLGELKQRDIDGVVLAGFLKILSKEFVEIYKNKIINIHPSLIPAFCGNGFYGEKVHQGVLDYGVKYTGATVHFVEEGTDTGPIILQEVVPVAEDETLPTLKEKVLKLEHELLVKAVALFCEDKIKVEGRMVKIIEE